MGLKRKLIIAMMLVAVLAQWPVAASAVASQSVVVPAYNYPERGGTNSYWNGLLSSGGSGVPILIANVNSGPGEVIKADYQVTLNKAKAAGSRVVGYVRTGYESRSMQQVLTKIDRWYALYGHKNIDGIFFDEISNMYVSNQSKLCYLSTVYNYVKAKYGGIVFANPGSQVSDAMAPYADVFVAAEYDIQKYKSDYKPPVSSFEKNPANQNRIMHMVYGVSSGELGSVVQLSRQRNAGYLFVTDDGGDNPYDALPTYFSQFANHVKAMPATAAPREPAKHYPIGCLDIATTAQQTDTKPGSTTTNLMVTNTARSQQQITLPVQVTFQLPEGALLNKLRGDGWNCQGNSCSYQAQVARGAQAAPLSVRLRSASGGKIAYTVKTANQQQFSQGAVAVPASKQPAPQPLVPAPRTVPKPPHGYASSDDLANTGVNPLYWLLGGGALLASGIIVIIVIRRTRSQ